MATTTVMLLCLAVVLAASVHGSPVQKRNADTPPYPADNDADSANHEENEAVGGHRNVRHRAQTVLQIFLQIHNARHKNSYSLRLNDKSYEHIVTIHDGRQEKNNGTEFKYQVYWKVD